MKQPTATLAYLFPAFPVFHQTFVLWEVLGLRRNGLIPKIYSLRPPTRQQQPEAREVSAEVVYLPGLLSTPVLRANWRRMRVDLRGYARLYAAVVQAWRTGHAAPAGDVADARVSLYDRVRGWFNSHPLPYLGKSLLLVPSAVYFAECLERDGVRHLHVHWASFPATIAYVVHLQTGLPFSISAHAYDIYMVPWMLPAKLRAARFVVTCAKANAAFLRRLVDSETGKRIMVSYHGVDVGRFTPADPASTATDRLTVVSCGQLEHYKGMHHLIDACAELIRRGIAVDCRIVGEGPQRGRLERQIAQLGLSAQIHLVGAQPHAEVAALLQKADLFVLASEVVGQFGRRDVIANVIVEAMAAGLPVVASRVPGVEELVEHAVTGYLVPPNSVEDLAAAMAALANSPVDRGRFGQAGRRRVLRDFDNRKNVHELAERLMQSLAEAMGTPGPDAAVGVPCGAVG